MHRHGLQRISEIMPLFLSINRTRNLLFYSLSLFFCVANGRSVPKYNGLNVKDIDVGVPIWEKSISQFTLDFFIYLFFFFFFLIQFIAHKHKVQQKILFGYVFIAVGEFVHSFIRGRKCNKKPCGSGNNCAKEKTELAVKKCVIGNITFRYHIYISRSRTNAFCRHFAARNIVLLF